MIDGEVSMLRASEVYWCEDSKMWTACIKPWFRRNDEPHMFSHKSRQACIDWEIAYLNNRTRIRKDAKGKGVGNEN
jgi:hypothetical protein